MMISLTTERPHEHNNTNTALHCVHEDIYHQISAGRVPHDKPIVQSSMTILSKCLITVASLFILNSWKINCSDIVGLNYTFTHTPQQDKAFTFKPVGVC